jgi:FtsP/CotA-like multicopper oxidase with cupredoxin domain
MHSATPDRLIHPTPSSSASGPLVEQTATAPAQVEPAERPSLSRRRFLRAAAATGGGLVAVGVAACSPAAGPSFSFGPPFSPLPSPGGSAGPAGGGSPPPTPASTMDHGSPAPTSAASAVPAADHDANALAVVKRFLGGEYESVPGLGNQPVQPRLDGGVKVFELTVDEFDHRIDAQKDPVHALGFNAMWPGPRITVVEGDRIRAVFRNNLKETTGIHFHGQRIPNAMDGVPHITQEPIKPGESFTYEFTVRTPGSHMYHSHHNATDQVGRGLLGAFIVEPRDAAARYASLYRATQDIVWISNDSLGGFTINGRGFPATAPIVATVGETIVVRFMNEGNMMHPWHLHGMPMHVVARDGYALGSAAFTCDTLGVNPGERWDVVIRCEDPGAWAFHCHILQHAEAQDGMFGMVTALVIRDAATAAAGAAAGESTVVTAARSAGSTALTCRIGGLG